MRASNIALVTCATLVLGTASAGAGPCKQEIMDVTKKLAATDAGSGPSTGHPRADGWRPERSASRYVRGQ
jgi:hypothetical protein